MAQRLISFELTMPNKGSWNGKWTGDGDKYFIVKQISDKYLKSKEHFEKLLKHLRDSFYYSFGDGWGANVIVEIVDAKEAKKRRKESKGFSGYDWMVDSIIYKGKIIA